MTPDRWKVAALAVVVFALGIIVGARLTGTYTAIIQPGAPGDRGTLVRMNTITGKAWHLSGPPPHWSEIDEGAGK